MTLPDTFWVGVTGSVIFGALGIFLLLVGFKLFDWITPKIDFQKRIDENPIAASIVVGSFFLSVAWIVSSVVH